MEITFGTDGWRGIIGKDFTVANALTVAQALADYLLAQQSDPVCVVGYDTRFMSDYFAQEISQVLAGNGIKVLLTEKPVTSPVLSHATKNISASGGIMVTASHNPPIYNGIKFKGPYGGSALPSVVSSIENYLSLNSIKKTSANSPLIEYFNPDHAYLKSLLSMVNIEKILDSGFKFAVDTMYGSAQGYFKQMFQENHNLTELHNFVNPSFGGVNPEPIGKNLEELSRLVVNRGLNAGIALDGDGDRIGVVCSNGAFMNSHQIFALLLMYLKEYKKLGGGVVKTFSTSKMIDILASSYNLPLYETPIGFKYICDLFLAEDILIGGEESGGIGFKNHLPERDGILSGLLLLELMAETGNTPENLLEALAKRIGTFFHDRKDLSVSPTAKERFNEYITKEPPSVFAGLPVCEVKDLDGIKFCLAKDSWVLFRFSGTEPVLRLYAESSTPETVSLILSEAERLARAFS